MISRVIIVTFATLALATAFDCTGKPPGTLRWFYNTTAANVGDPSQIRDNTVYFSVATDNTQGYGVRACISFAHGLF